MPKLSTQIYFLSIIALLVILSATIYHAKHQIVVAPTSHKPPSRMGHAYSIPPLGTGDDIPPLTPVYVPRVGKPLVTAQPPKVWVAPAKAVPVIPEITAESYLVGNLTTGEIYSAKYPDQTTPIASISKLFTVLVAGDMNTTGIMKHDSPITITEKMLLPYGSEGHLVVGEQMTPDELVYPLLLESSNDAAEALAEPSGYGDFVSAMRNKARDLGLGHTTFDDPSGLSSKNVSTARDLFGLARYLYSAKSDILATTRLTDYGLASTTLHGGHHFVNMNPFLGDPHFIGGKTGRTPEARESMLSLFSYKVGNISYPVAVIVLRSDYSSRQIDSSLLFEQFLTKVGGAH